MSTSQAELKEIERTASAVATQAGKVLMNYYGTLAQGDITVKAKHDFVSDADRNSEAICLESLSREFPDFDFLGEEGSSIERGGRYRWIIDPLDGTTNFLRGIPVFAVAIGLEDRSQRSGDSPYGKRIVGVVHNPATGDLWCASDGNGAYRNDKKIEVNRSIPFDEAIFATGFPFRAKQFTDVYLSAWKAMFLAGSSMRRCGAAEMDLCWVASGVLDGYWEINLGPWDIAAGEVIVREAGGLVGSFGNHADPLVNGCIWASAPQLFDQGMSILLDKFGPGFTPKGV